MTQEQFDNIIEQRAHLLGAVTACIVHPEIDERVKHYFRGVMDRVKKHSVGDLMETTAFATISKMPPDFVIDALLALDKKE